MVTICSSISSDYELHFLSFCVQGIKQSAMVAGSYIWIKQKNKTKTDRVYGFSFLLE